jgi:hypothetical protein
VEYGVRGRCASTGAWGVFPSHRLPTEDEGEASGFSRAGWPLIGPDEAAATIPASTRSSCWAVSPQYLDGHLIGTVDTSGLLGVEGRRTRRNAMTTSPRWSGPIPALHRLRLGQPRLLRGPAAAVAELERAVTAGLGLAGVKLYPMYRTWGAPTTATSAFPILTARPPSSASR